MKVWSQSSNRTSSSVQCRVSERIFFTSELISGCWLLSSLMNDRVFSVTWAAMLSWKVFARLAVAVSGKLGLNASVVGCCMLLSRSPSTSNSDFIPFLPSCTLPTMLVKDRLQAGLRCNGTWMGGPSLFERSHDDDDHIVVNSEVVVVILTLDLHVVSTVLRLLSNMKCLSSLLRPSQVGS